MLLPSGTIGSDGNHGEVEWSNLVANLLEGRAVGHVVLVLAVRHTPVPSISISVKNSTSMVISSSPPSYNPRTPSQSNIRFLPSKEDLDRLLVRIFGLGLHHPRRPQGLVVVMNAPPREMLAWRAEHFNITLAIMERVLVPVPPVALAHLGRLDPDRVKPRLVPQGYVKVRLVLLLQVLDRSQVQVIVVVVADHDDVDPG